MNDFDKEVEERILTKLVIDFNDSIKVLLRFGCKLSGQRILKYDTRIKEVGNVMKNIPFALLVEAMRRCHHNKFYRGMKDSKWRRDLTWMFKGWKGSKPVKEKIENALRLQIDLPATTIENIRLDNIKFLVPNLIFDEPAIDLGGTTEYNDGESEEDIRARKEANARAIRDL